MARPYVLQSYIAAIEAEVKTLPVAKDIEVEVEVRFRDITVAIFERVKADLRKRAVPVAIATTDFIVNGQRLTLAVVPTVAAPTGIEPHSTVPTVSYAVTTITKTGKWHRFIDDYGLKVAISEEKAITAGVTTQLDAYRDSATLIRTKQRSQFRLFNGDIHVDLTQVTEEKRAKVGDPFSRPKTQWELEAEIVGKVDRSSLTKLDQVISLLLLPKVQDTEVVYTHSIRDAVIASYNTILGAGDGPVLNHEVIVQARDLKRRDCVWGGLLGGKIKYAVTPKAEGVRKQLFFHETGRWLVFPPLELNRLTTGTTKEEQPLIGTILDGELIPPERRQGIGLEVKALYYYLPFDVMAVSGSCAVQSLHLFKRLEYRDALVAKLPPANSGGTFVVGPKEFIALGSTVAEMEKALGAVKASLAKLPWKSDGYMFTPIEAEYNPHSDTKYELRQRVLSGRPDKEGKFTHPIPDVCKLKPWALLTIDLRFVRMLGLKAPALLEVNEQTGGHKQQWLSSCKRDPRTARTKPQTRAVPWAGTPFDPIDLETQVNWSHDLFAGLSTNSIVEFGPSRDAKGTIILQPVMIRTNKTNPNRREIADDVWADINNPLTEATLLGQTLDLVFQYHNQVKRQLFDLIPKDSDLVDIGYGRGGDIPKQRHLHRILAIEPNSANLAEAKRRADLKLGAGPPMADRICFLQASGTETKTIVDVATTCFNWAPAPPPLTGAGGTGGTGAGSADVTAHRVEPPPLCITMMLSLSFFWKDAATLQALAATLQGLRAAYRAAGGTRPVYFLYLTIDGELLYSAFMKEGKARADGIRTLDFGPAHFEYTAPNIVSVDIKDSIVEKQTEYLVNMPELERLALISPHQRTPTVHQQFLSPMAAQYSRMYVYGAAIISDPVSEKPTLVTK